MYLVCYLIKYSCNIQFILVILDILLAVTIERISRERLKLVGSGSGGRSELNTAIVILLMAALPLLIFIPNAIFWAPYILSSLLSDMNPKVIFLCSVLGLITFILGILVHVWNIFVYTARVPSFRVELVRILTCGLYKPLSTHSQSFASSQFAGTQK